MKKENASGERPGIGKDYINDDGDLIIIDRVGVFGNKGFYEDLYRDDFCCINYASWLEATESEVVDAFKKHLVYRYGEDWETMKIKEEHPDSSLGINDNLWGVKISREDFGWSVWNKNGVLYRNGIWVERLEESKIHIKEAIKGNTAIHCATEQEAKRILGMAHKLGHTWVSGELYIGDTRWGVNESKTCYPLLDGGFAHYNYFKDNNYNIIPSTQIADLEPAKTTEWVPAPEDIEEIEKLPINKVTTRDLDIALRMVGIQLDVNIIGKVIDLVALIENTGDDVTIKDVVSLQQTW